MTILAVDDEALSLKDLARCIREASPDAELLYFMSPADALSRARAQRVHAAFLDIEMAGMSGLALAKELKDLQPDMRIVFVTGYDKYALDAFALHASGYLLKPVQVGCIRRELDCGVLDAPPPSQSVRVQTFGGFEVYVNGRPLVFRRQKSKELLAVLIDRRGASLTTREACAVLFEDAEYSTAQKNYYQTIVAELRCALSRAGVGALLQKRRNALSIDPARVDCDSYRFLAGEPQAVNSYRHDYMPCYSWAEFTLGALDARLENSR